MKRIGHYPTTVTTRPKISKPFLKKDMQIEVKTPKKYNQ